MASSASAESWRDALAMLWDDDCAYQRFSARAAHQARRVDHSAGEVGDRLEGVLAEMGDGRR
jgi:hypothetical protein